MFFSKKPASRLRSFGGKFDPTTGRRVVDTCVDEVAQARTAITHLAALEKQIRQLIDEPLRVRWQLKLGLVTIALVICQLIGYAVYQTASDVRNTFFVEHTQRATSPFTAELAAANAALTAGDITTAEAGFDAILKRDAKQAAALDGLGFAAKLRGDDTAARTYFSSAIAIDPDDMMAHQNLGVIMLTAGETKGALTHFNRVIDVEPGNTTVAILAAKALIADGAPGQAVERLRDVIEMKPDMLDAYIQLIAAYTAMGDTTGATHARAEAATQFPNDIRFSSSTR